MLLFYPRLGKVDLYLDWRIAFSQADAPSLRDFDEAALVVADAWDQTVEYVENAWQRHLLPTG